MIKIDYVSVDSIVPNQTNPRKISNKQLQSLIKSLQENQEYFEARPIICSSRTGQNVIIAGNQRYLAAKTIGFETVPCIILNNLSEEKEKELVIRDNVSSGEWNLDMLKEWDADLLEKWGLEIEFPEEIVSQEGEDDAPGEPIQPRTVPGDLYELGDHRLLCGDSSILNDLEKLIGQEKINLLFTDPPYGVSIGEKNKMLNSFQKAGRNLSDIKDDSLSSEELYEKLKISFSNAKMFMAPDASFYVTAPQAGNQSNMVIPRRISLLSNQSSL